MQRNLWKTVFLSLWSMFLALCGMGGIAFSIHIHKWNPNESLFTVWLFLGMGLLYVFYGTFTLGEMVGPIITERRLKNFRFLAQSLLALYEKLREQVAAEWKELEPMIAEGKALMAKHDEIVARYQEVCPAIESITEYLENINKEYQAKLLEKTSMEKTLAEYTQLNQTISKQVDALQKDLSGQQNMVNARQAEQNNLQQQLIQGRKEYETLQMEQTRLNEQLAILTNEERLLTEEINRHKQEIERLTGQKEEDQRTISMTSAKIAGLQDDIQETKVVQEKTIQEIQIKESENTAAHAELENLRQQLEQKRCERDKNLLEIRSLEDERQAMAKKLQDETRQLKELRQDNETDQRKLTKLTNEKNKLTEEKALLLKDINAAEKERKLWQQEREELKAKYHSYKSFIESREKELNEPQIKKIVSQAMEALVRLEG